MRRILLLLAIGGIIAFTACSSSSTPRPSTTNSNRVISATLLRGSSTVNWPVFGYDARHTGYVDQALQPRIVKGKVLWVRKLGPVFSSPVAGLGMLYIASTDGYLYALKQETGAVLWRVHVGNHLTDATPALQGRVLFVALHSSALEALDAATGQVYWTFDTAEKIQAPPLVAGQDVLVASRSTFWVLDAASGRLRWKFYRGGSGWPTTGSPAIGDTTVYFGLGAGTRIWALNLADGSVNWSFDTGDRITSTVVVGANTVYVATWRGTIFALSRTTGAKRWSYALNSQQGQSVVDGVGGSMALAGDNLYVGDYRGSVLCLNVTRGDVSWRYATGAQVLATPIVAAGLVYIGSSDGYFYALDTQTGRPSWRFPTGDVRSSASFVNNRLYVGSLNGMMYAFV